MSLNLGSAAATITLDASDFIKNAKSAGDAVGSLQSQTSSVSNNGGFLNWVNANSSALTTWGKALTVVGGLMTTALVAPLALGSKAAWNQVSAVEQATLALRAYETDASKVDAVLAGLLDYARSDMGVLFSREELFAAAQSMKIFGAETENLVDYTEILSRSVGLGLSDWDSLNTVIGRVGATGRLTGNDFDMLTQRGYKLDESLRNTDITWDELFVALDKGMPADALAGQADTIAGKTIRLQSALRGLGLAFLGVDADTSKFIKGGLGDTIMKGLQQLTDLLKRARPAAQTFGRTMAVAAQMASRFVDFIIGLPQPVQTAILVITGIVGAVLTAAGAFLAFLPVIAAFVTSFGAIGGLSGILGGLGMAATAALGPVRLLGAGVMAIFANPILLAGAIAIGAAILAYKTNFMGFGDMVRDALGWVQDLWAALQLVFGKTHQTTGNFDIVTTADNVWDQWQLQEDGTWKNATLGVTSTADEGTLQYMGLDENTGKWMVMHLSKTGEEIPGEILSSSQSESDPTKFFMEIQLEGGEKITAVYDEVSGTYQILEDPAQMIVETDEAVTNVETLSERVNNMVEWLTKAKEWADKLGAQLDALMTSNWDAFDWRLTLDLVGLESLIEPIETLIGWYNDLRDSASDAKDAIDSVFGGGIVGTNLILGMGANTGGQQAADWIESGGVTREERPRTATNRGQSDINFSPAGIGFNVATSAIDNYRIALESLKSPSSQATIDNNLMASSTLPVGVNMTTTSGQVGAAGSSIGSTFAGIAASAVTNFSAAQSTATSQMGALASGATAQAISARSNVVSQFAAMQSGTVASAIGMQAGVSARMAALQAVVTSQASSARANAVSQFSSMSASTAGKFMGMQAQAAVQMAIMASTASTQGNATMSNLVGAIAGGMARVYAALSAVPRAVSSMGGSAASTAYSIGANISGSFASGMWAFMGQISAAAAAMVNAASAALRAKAMIASPSKLFKQYGAFVGEGFELGIRDSIPGISRAADAMLGTGMPSPAFSAPLHGGGGGYGGGTTVIDNSRVEYIALTESDFQQLLAKSDRGNQAYAHLSDPDAHNYGGA